MNLANIKKFTLTTLKNLLPRITAFHILFLCIFGYSILIGPLTKGVLLLLVVGLFTLDLFTALKTTVEGLVLPVSNPEPLLLAETNEVSLSAGSEVDPTPLTVSTDQSSDSHYKIPSRVRRKESGD